MAGNMGTTEKPKTENADILPQDAALFYICDMLGELSEMADLAGLTDLADVLRAAKVSAR